MHKKKLFFSLSDLAKRTSCQLIGDANHLIYSVADLETATPSDASFLANPQYIQTMKETQAGVVFIDHKTTRDQNKNFLISDNPSRSFQQVIELFNPPRLHPSGFKGIHPTAVIHPSSILGNEVTIGPLAIIDENVTIGDRTFIGAGSSIGPDTTIGSECIIHARVVIREECVIQDRVIIQPGAVIGGCGFGYTTDAKGRHTKLNQVGNVILENDVEIGSNTTVDRSRFKSTVIRQGTKIDNLVQIGHGVIVGPCNLIIAQSCIAGSTTTGRCVVLAGQVAVAGHLHLADGVMVAGKSGVSKSLSTGKYGGIPAVPLTEHNRNAVFLRNIENYVNQIKDLQKRLNQLELKIIEG